MMLSHFVLYHRNGLLGLHGVIVLKNVGWVCPRGPGPALMVFMEEKNALKLMRLKARLVF
jgi:hypothetical protein